MHVQIGYMHTKILARHLNHVAWLQYNYVYTCMRTCSMAADMYACLFMYVNMLYVRRSWKKVTWKGHWKYFLRKTAGRRRRTQTIIWLCSTPTVSVCVTRECVWIRLKWHWLSLSGICMRIFVHICKLTWLQHSCAQGVHACTVLAPVAAVVSIRNVTKKFKVRAKFPEESVYWVDVCICVCRMYVQCVWGRTYDTYLPCYLHACTSTGNRETALPV